jgi:hypothetical protein
MNAGQEASQDPEEVQAALDRVAAVKRIYQDDLLAKANVVGVGVGYAQRGGQPTQDPALVVMVTQKLPPDQLHPDDLVPRQIEGVPVDVQEVGEIKAF